MNSHSENSSPKPINNAGLKYLENFNNPYVKIVPVCKQCNKEQSLKYPGTWKRHFLTHAAKEDLPHKCDLCFRAFVTATNLKNHKKVHNKNKAPKIEAPSYDFNDTEHWS